MVKCHNRKKHLSKSEIQMIKMGKFIPGLFSDISATFTKLVKISINLLQIHRIPPHYNFFSTSLVLSK